MFFITFHVALETSFTKYLIFQYLLPEEREEKNLYTAS